MNILFLGHNKWACLTLDALIKTHHKIIGVMTETEDYDSKEHANYKRFEKFGAYGSLKKCAHKYKLKIYTPKDINSDETLALIDSLKPEIIVMVSYHQIIKEKLLEKYTIINAHGAPLPKYRGRAPINWAIINNENHTGVTVHFVAKGIDGGDIIEQEFVPIHKSDRAIDVLKRSLPLYPKLVIKALGKIEKGNFSRIKQDQSKATYMPKRTPADGVIDWNKTALEIYNLIRALAEPYPGAFTYYNHKKIFVWEAELCKIQNKSHLPAGQLIKLDSEKKGAFIATNDGTILMTKIQEEGNKKTNAFAYFRKIIKGEKLSKIILQKA